MTTWVKILDWIADYAIYLASVISLCITLLSCFINLPIKTYSKVIYIIISITFILAIPHFTIFFYYPVTIVPIVGLMLTLIILKNKNFNTLQIYSTIAYIINCLLYSYATELSKANYSSWGSSTIYVGIFMIVFIFPLFHLILLTHPQYKTFGIFKVLTGVILLSICWIQNFPPIHEGKDVNEQLDFIRYGIVFSMIVITFEGLLLIFQKRLRAKFNKLN